MTTPKTPPDRDSRSVVQGALRRKRRLTVRELAARTGLSEAVLSEAEKGGTSAPARRRLGKVAGDMHYVPGLTDFLVDLLDAGGAPPRAPEHPLQPSREEALRQQEQALAQGREHYGKAWQSLAKDWYDRRVAQHRAEAARLGEEILTLPLRERWGRVERADPAPLWALVDWLCEASEKAASDDARRAVQLAELALFAARHPGCPARWRDRLAGYALAFLANARRVFGDLPGADAAFAAAWERWKAGEGSRSGLPLADWRLPDLEASLRRAQQRWGEMVRLSKRALAIAPKEARGRILLKQSEGYAQMGALGPTLKALRRARPLVMGAGDVRLECVLLFNLAKTLEQVGQVAEAEALLPAIRKRSSALRNELDLLRIVWLEARIDAARGRKSAAAAALALVGRGFAVREIAYDTALAGLEEGVLRLDLGETERALKLALDMHWIFLAQQVAPAALAALRLYCEAAEQGRLTLELARQALSDFRQAGSPAPAEALAP